MLHSAQETVNWQPLWPMQPLIYTYLYVYNQIPAIIFNMLKELQCFGEPTKQLARCLPLFTLSHVT
jgi:hypothetical protein